MPAPIALFVFNRPEHTRRLLESLSTNPEAAASELFVFADGPKSIDENALVEEVREVIRSHSPCGTMQIFASPVNQGLATSIVSGVRSVLARFDRVIVLEDDLIVSPGFLEYMNRALDLYVSDERVMQIAGHVCPLPDELPETFFLRRITSWGWATWRRAFDYYREDAAILLRDLETSADAHHFNLCKGDDFLRQLKANACGAMNTWAIKWHASAFLRGGFGLFPKRTLVRNAGHDGTGTHSPVDLSKNEQPFGQSIRVESQAVEESATAREAMWRAMNPGGNNLAEWARERIVPWIKGAFVC